MSDPLRAYRKAADDLYTEAINTTNNPSELNLKTLGDVVRKYHEARSLYERGGLAEMASTSKPGPVQTLPPTN